MAAIQPVKGMISDLDDTLIATRINRWMILLDALAQNGVVVSDDDLRAQWGKPFFDLISNIAPDLDTHAFVNEYVKAISSSSAGTTPGAKRLIKAAKQREIPVLILSSSPRRLAIHDLWAVGLLGFVDRIWCVEDVPFFKPDPRVLLPVVAYLTQRGVPRSQTVYFGDSLEDYVVARSHDLTFVATLTGLATREDFRRAGMADDLIFESLNEFLDDDAANALYGAG